MRPLELQSQEKAGMLMHAMVFAWQAMRNEPQITEQQVG